MGTNKQEQLDLFEGRTTFDNDDSDTDQDSQVSTEQQLLASTAATAFTSQPSRSFSTWQGPDSVESAPDRGSGQCSCQSGTVAESELGCEQPPGGDETDLVDPKEDSSSSGDDTSSSDSDSSSNSDDDPDGVQPIEMATGTHP